MRAPLKGDPWSFGQRLDIASHCEPGALNQVLEAPGASMAGARTGAAIRRMADYMPGFSQGPLYDAGAAGSLALAHLLGPMTPFLGNLIKCSMRRGRPVAVLIEDDPAGGPSLGPQGWSCVRRLVAWAPAAVFITDPDAEREIYAEAGPAAEHHERVLVVEASAVTAPLWQRTFDCHRNCRVLN